MELLILYGIAEDITFNERNGISQPLLHITSADAWIDGEIDGRISDTLRSALDVFGFEMVVPGIYTPDFDFHMGVKDIAIAANTLGFHRDKSFEDAMKRTKIYGNN